MVFFEFVFLLYHKKKHFSISKTAKYIAIPAVLWYTMYMDTLHIENSFYGKGETTFSYAYRPHPNPTEIGHTHLHNSYEILLFYEGDANYHIGGDIYHLSKNDLLIIRPSVYHSISLLSSRPYERIVLSFYEDQFPLNIASFLQNVLPFYHIPDEHPILQIFQTLRESFKLLSREDFEQFFMSATTNILLLLPHLQQPNLTKKRDAVQTSNFDNILAYIDKNPDKPLTLGWLSKTFFLSESHISHLFKSKLNTSAMQYIHLKKISYAHSLLVSGIPPTQVAEKCSFKNYSTFYRLYKKFFGVTPKSGNQ